MKRPSPWPALASIVLLFTVFPETSLAVFSYVESYPQALDAAQRSGWPVAIYFVTDSCRPCRKFEHDTLDTARIAAMNAQFIFVRVNGRANPQLAERFKIREYPSIVFIDKNGNVLDNFGGYVTQDVFAARAWEAFKAAGPIVAARDLEKVQAELQKAQAAFEKGDYRTAIQSLLLLASARIELEPIKQARELLAEIEDQGAAEVEAAKALAAEKKFKEALQKLRDISTRYAGSSAEKQAKEAAAALLVEPEVAQLKKEDDAQELLNSARASCEAGQYAEALEQLQNIVDDHADTGPAKEAASDLERMMADPKITRQLDDERAAARCRGWLSTARSFEINKDYRRAIEYYDKVINERPDSSFAEEARQNRAEAEKHL